MRLSPVKPFEWIDSKSPIEKQILFCLNRGNERLIKDFNVIKNFDFSSISTNTISEIIELALNTGLLKLPISLGENESLRKKIVETPKLLNLIKNKSGDLVDSLTEDSRIFNLINTQQTQRTTPIQATTPKPTTNDSKPRIALRGGMGDRPALIHPAHTTPPAPKITEELDVPFGGRINNIAITTPRTREIHAIGHSSQDKPFILRPTSQTKPEKISLFDLKLEEVIPRRQIVTRASWVRGATPFFLRIESNHDLKEEFKSLSPLSHYIDLAKNSEYRDLKSVFEFGKNEETLNPINIRRLLDWAKENPSHSFSLGIACNPKLIELLKPKELLELKRWAESEENKDKKVSKCLIVTLQNTSSRKINASNGQVNSTSSTEEVISLYDLLALRTQRQVPLSPIQTETNQLPSTQTLEVSDVFKDESDFTKNLYKYLTSTDPGRKVRTDLITFLSFRNNKDEKCTRAMIEAAKLEHNKNNDVARKLGRTIIISDSLRGELLPWVRENQEHSFSIGLIKGRRIKL